MKMRTELKKKIHFILKAGHSLFSEIQSHVPLKLQLWTLLCFTLCYCLLSWHH